MWSRGGLWLVRVRAGKVRLCLPFPLYVLVGVCDAAEDLCALLLPRLGLPNYARLGRELLCALDGAGVEVDTAQCRVMIRQILPGGHGHDRRCA